MRRTFTLEYWRDEGWYVGRLKEVPGIFSQAESLKKLEENIREAYNLMMSTEVFPDVSVKHKEKDLVVNV